MKCKDCQIKIKRSEVNTLQHLDIDCIKSLNVKYFEQSQNLKDLEIKMKEIEKKNHAVE
jgi:hypothetical protein